MNKVYSIKNLDCANCASKVETAINKIDEVHLATIDFMAQKLYVEYSDDCNIDDVFTKIKKTAQKLESDIQITDYNENNKSHTHNHCCCNDHCHEHPEHEHNHEHNNKLNSKDVLIIRLILTFICMVIPFIFSTNNLISLIFYLIGYFIIGYDVLLNAFKNILKGKVFDENFLMSIATIGALAISDYMEAIAVMIFYQIGEYFQDYAVKKSRKSITELMDIKPDYANLKIDNEIKKVSPFDIKQNDIIVVKAGEKVPLDGIVIKGNSFVDSLALTGESVPKQVNVGDEILSGVINTSEVLEIKVTKLYEQSTVYKILQLVESASSKKAKVENFITKFSRYYTPIVVILAVLLATIPPLFLDSVSFRQCFTNALTFLVISCPCALVISVPLSFFAGIGGASKMGVLIKESRYLETLSKVDTVVFDKTGTLTQGVFDVQEINAKNISEEDFIKYSLYAELFSNHPIAKSIQKKYATPINQENISNYKDIAGFGVSLNVGDDFVLFGNSKLMEKYNIKYDKPHIYGTICYLAVNNEYKGYLVISDKVKSDAKKAIKNLKNIGIKNIIMLTGDTKKSADFIAKELGIEKVYSELLPTNKVEILEKIIANSKKKIAFVGDGINDAPVLTRADVGISMGGVGSDSAIEASDIVIMTDEPIKIVNAIKHSKFTLKIVKQNIIFALTIKILFLILGAFGLIPMLGAVFADVGVSMIAILNSIRALYVKKDVSI